MMLNKDLREKLNLLSRKNNAEIIDKMSLINKAFPGDFNYSIGEAAILEKYGRYLPITDHWLFSIIQPCIRINDFFVNKKSDTGLNFYLALFEMADIGGISWTNNREEISEVRKNSIQKTYNFLVNELSIDSARIYINYFSGSTIKELSGGRIPSDKYLKADLETVDCWQKLGLSDRQLVPDATQKTFVLTFFPFEFYAGYRSEVFIRIKDVMEPIEVGTFQFLDLQTKLDKSGQFYDIIPMKGFFGGSVIGIERLLCAANEFSDIYLCDHIRSLYEEIIKNSRKKDLVSARILTEAIRLMHAIITDSCSLSGGIQEKRRYKLRKIVKKAVISASTLKLDFKELLPSLFISNAELNSWNPELKESCKKAISIISKFMGI